MSKLQFMSRNHLAVLAAYRINTELLPCSQLHSKQQTQQHIACLLLNLCYEGIF